MFTDKQQAAIEELKELAKNRRFTEKVRTIVKRATPVIVESVFPGAGLLMEAASVASELSGSKAANDLIDPDMAQFIEKLGELANGADKPWPDDPRWKMASRWGGGR